MRTLPAVLFLGATGLWLWSLPHAPLHRPGLEQARERASALGRPLLIFGSVPGQCADICVDAKACRDCPAAAHASLLRAMTLREGVLVQSYPEDGVLLDASGVPLGSETVVSYVADLEPGIPWAELGRVSGRGNVLKEDFLYDLGADIEEDVLRKPVRYGMPFAMAALGAWSFWPNR